MAEKFTPITTSNLANQTSFASAIDNNFTTIATLLNDVLSLEGNTPNQMLSSLDMNSNQIINVGAPTSLNSAVRLQDLANINNTGSVGTATTVNTANSVGSATTVDSANNVNGGVTTATNVTNANSVTTATSVYGADTVGTATNVYESTWRTSNVSANYTLQASDNNTNILGSTTSGGFTITVNAYTSYSSPFSVNIFNTSAAGNAAILISVTGSQSFYLLPGQEVNLYVGNAKWQTQPQISQYQSAGTYYYLAQRWTALNPTVYVSTTGNDNNDGLTSETAFATIQNAANFLKDIANPASSWTYIQLSPGTYDVSTLGLSGRPTWILGITGNASSPGSYTLTTSTGSVDISDYSSVVWTGLTFTSTCATGFGAWHQYAVSDFSDCVFGNMSTFAQMDSYSKINLTGTCTFNLGSSCDQFIYLNNGGNLEIGGTSYPCSPMTFANAFLVISGSGSSAVMDPGTTFTGTGAGSGSVGQQIEVLNFGSFTGYTSSIPGNSKGIWNIIPGSTSGTILTTAGAIAANTGISNPTGTISTTGVMMGLGIPITSNASSRVIATFCGELTNNTASDGTQLHIRYGTGSAPVNGASSAGTQISGIVACNPVPTGCAIPFSVTGVVTGLTPGVAYWFDLQMASITGGTSSLANLSCVLTEI